MSHFPTEPQSSASDPASRLLQMSYLKVTNIDYIDEMLTRYNQDPHSVDESWRYFFEGIEVGSSDPVDFSGLDSTVAPLQPHELSVYQLICAYREYGKFIADVNPLGTPPASHPALELSRFGLSEAHLNQSFQAASFLGLPASSSLQAILQKLKEIYCGKVGVEVSQVSVLEERQWIQNRIESGALSASLSDTETRKFILKRLTQSEGFEKFLHTRYVAQKRFSIEGGESAIAALDCMIEQGAELGADEFVIGMAHRGRLNVLTHLMGKKPEYIFTEFEGTYKTDLTLGEGDVKYHMGYSRDFKTRRGKPVHLSLANNPSHLEFVNPVVEGMVRAKQQQKKDDSRTRVVPLLIHGDAAFSGQGVCFETLAMSQLKGYFTGGTLHLVINNQVGFTTFPKDSRSTPFSTDLAKLLDAPILHINGDSPEAVWNAAAFAIEFRQKFKKDVVLDLVCYRRHGHNEGDEPSFTQPLMYKKIKTHPTTREQYGQALESAKVIPAGTAQAWVEEVTQELMAAQVIAKKDAPHPEVSVFEGRWKGLKRPSFEDFSQPVSTQVSAEKLKGLANKINTLPAGFQLHSKLQRFFEGRLKAVQEGKGIDWGNGESLAFASLVAEGHPVRITGQDAERGTFTHRHSVVTDFETGKTYSPFETLSSPSLFEVHNSHLSETAVLGFEYGYALSEPNALTIWEAQFGDFANGAQVLIDQFIATGESKWQRMNGLTLLLPHGYEGQGPEHSSARLERFLQLCGKNNLIICNMTTPAQLFHALRRQVKRSFRKPLVIFSPKSMLRHPAAISELSEFSDAGFQEVIPDREISAPQTKRILLCSGKVYYDLVAERTARKRNDVAIVRLEQIYPFPAQSLSAILNKSPQAQLVWVQEEPKNMGAWTFVHGMFTGGLDHFSEQVGGRSIRYVGRDWSASPAVGSPKVHEKELKSFLEKAFQD